MDDFLSAHDWLQRPLCSLDVVSVRLQGAIFCDCGYALGGVWTDPLAKIVCGHCGNVYELGLYLRLVEYQGKKTGLAEQWDALQAENKHTGGEV